MKTTLEIFSENLRDLLDKQHKTQRALAKYMQVTEATASRWVNGEAMPRADKVDKMAHFFMCSTDELTSSSERNLPLMPEDVIAEELRENAKLFKLFLVASKATDEQIEACIALLKK